VPNACLMQALESDPRVQTEETGGRRGDQVQVVSARPAS
jgi:hypothetical protein